MKKRILVVDDEEPIQELIYLYLTPLGVHVNAAYTGEDGVSMYAEMLEAGMRPDLVIMDLKLPGIDGVEAINRIMAMDPTACIFGFTAYSKSAWGLEMLNAGALQVIPRTVGFAGLRDIIDASLSSDEIMVFNQAQ